MKPEIALAAQSTLGEGTLWETRNETLYWVDIIEKKVQAFTPADGKNHVIQLEKYIGTVVTCEKGGLLVALEDGAYFIADGSREAVLEAPIEPGLRTNRLNDGKCDPAGRLVVGSMAMDKAGNSGERYQGSLYSVEGKMKVKTLISGLSVPNGIAWSMDGRTMYHVDSPAHTIRSYEYDTSTGNVGKYRTVIETPENLGAPDGMTIDSDGMLWVAMWGGWKVLHIDPRNGEILNSVEIPAELVTSCAFGGRNLDELYISTARTTLSEKQLAEQPHAGDIFVVRTGAAGLELCRYRGC